MYYGDHLRTFGRSRQIMYCTKLYDQIIWVISDRLINASLIIPVFDYIFWLKLIFHDHWSIDLRQRASLDLIVGYGWPWESVINCRMNFMKTGFGGKIGISES